MMVGEGNTHGSMLTGVASLIADRTGGVMSQLSKRAATQNPFSDIIREGFCCNHKTYILIYSTRAKKKVSVL